jgi:NTP pyrophosphatase (non-canonical NTP hydrolase)
MIGYENYGTAADKLIEECSELIKAICKARRFGPFALDPYSGVEYNNLDDIKREMADVNNAMAALEVELNQIKFEYYKVANENYRTPSF